MINNSNDIIDKEKSIVSLDKLSDSSLIYTVKVWVNTENYFKVKWDLNEKIKLAFDKNNIEIPYPQIDVHQK